MAREIAKCGTDSGYYRHRRHNEPACDDCRQAHRVVTREREQDRKRPKKPCIRCGGRVRAESYDTCSHCRKRTHVVEREKELVGWTQGQLIRRPIYRESEVA